MCSSYFKHCRGLIVAVATVGILIAVVFRAILKSVSKPAADSESEMQSSAATGSGVVTESQLKEATGEDGKPVYIAVKDPFSSSVTVFDMSGGSDFYGPGGPYHVFAGKNATHGLAKSSVDAAKVYGDLDKLTESEKDTHMQWYQKYQSKYPVVGNLVADDSKADEDVASTITTESKKDA